MLLSNPQLEHFRLLKRAVSLSHVELQGDLAHQLMVHSVREGVLVIDHNQVNIRRVFVRTKTSNRLMDVGWVLHEDIMSCLSCHVKFTLFARKHHCRACGSLICKQCSTRAMLIGFSALNTQIVCKTCNPQCAPEVQLRDLTKWGKVIYKAPTFADGPTCADFVVTARREVTAAPLSLELAATPGFVIKTKRTSLPDVKVFINVLHSDAIKDTHLMLTYVPSSPEVDESPVLQSLSIHPPQEESTRSITPPTGCTSATSVPPSGQNTFRSVSFADTPRTVESAPRYTSMSSDKRRAHVYSDYSSYVRLKANGSPDSASSISPRVIITSNNNNSNSNKANSSTRMQSDKTSPDAIPSNKNSPDSDKSDSSKTTVYLQVTPLVYVSAISTAEDKVGSTAVVYNVLISSDYFRSVAANNTQYCSAAYGNRVLITNPCAVNKIIQVVNQHYQHDLRETSYILPKIRQSFKGTMNPVSKPIVFNRTLCSVKCVPESECIRSEEHQRSSSVCSDISTSALSTILKAESDNVTIEQLIDPRTSPTSFCEAQAELSQPSPQPISTTTTAPTVTNIPNVTNVSNVINGNQRSISNDFYNISRRDSHSSMSSVRTSDWYSRSRTFLSVYGFVHKNDARRSRSRELTPEMMELKPSSCMTIQESDELKRQSVHDPTVLLGYQIICPYTHQADLPLIADQSLIYIITDLRRNKHFHTEYKLSQFALTGNSKWERLQRSERKPGTEFRITCQSFDAN